MITTEISSEAQHNTVQSWRATGHCRSRSGPFIDWKTGPRRDGSRDQSASGLCTGQSPRPRFQSKWKGALTIGKEPTGALKTILLKLADIPELSEDLPDVTSLAKEMR
jgi:hypothetical protein